MLTIFSVPKPFRGHIKVIQINAIRSWLLLRPACEVILFGNEEGTAEIASKLGIRHIPDVECNEYGTPLVSSIFKIAQNIARHELMCYVNADIILVNDFLESIHRVQKRSFLLVGQRWDVDLKKNWDFNKSDWEVRLRTYLTEEGKLHAPSGLDYFVFPRGLYQDIPPFAIGRPAWDGWMAHQAHSLGAPVIDATDVVTVVHQNHDYSHYPGGKMGLWQGPEANHNRGLAKPKHYVLGLHNATLILTPHGLRPALTRKHLWLRLRAMRYSLPCSYSLERVIRALARLKKRLSSERHIR